MHENLNHKYSWIKFFLLSLVNYNNQVLTTTIMSLQAISKNYYGHSAHVTSVRFTHDDEHLLSAGGDDSWWVMLHEV